MRTLRSLRWAMLALIGIAIPLFAASAARRPLVAQDLWAMVRLGSPKLSPDGRQVVFTVQTWSVEKNKSTTHLWLIDVAGGEPRQLTRAAGASDTAPEWSPEGRRIAFLSKRGEDTTAALYVLPVDGGEPERLVEMPLGLSTPRWLPDGQSLVFVTKVLPECAGTLAPEDLAAMRRESKRRRESKMTAHATENRIYRYWDRWQTELQADRLVRFDLATRKLTDLTPQSDLPWQIDGESRLALAPDGKKAVIVRTTGKPPYQERPYNHLWLVPLDGSGAWQDLTPGSGQMYGNPVFTPEGTHLICGRRSLPIYAGESQKLFRLEIATGKVDSISGPLDYSFDEWGFAEGGKRLWTVAEAGGHVPLWSLDAAAAQLTQLHAQGTCSAVDAVGPSIVYLHDTAMRPAELFVYDCGQKRSRQLTQFNTARVAALDLGRVESHTITGAAGDAVQMWLTYPPSYDPQRRYPLVQLMHGGPHTMVRDSWSFRWNAHLFAAPGYFAVWVNRHGSTGFGERFARSILQEWGDKPLEDIQKATDYLLAKFPNLDPKRVAAAGASYGGYMATWVAGHTDRYVCIINHAGVSDFLGQMGCDLAYTFTAPEVLGGTPWGNWEGMQRNNPIAYARNFKTPMLITHGELDYRVPFGQALTLYGVLQAMGVPTRFVSFPNENHWILTPQNSIYWNYEVQQWLARYLGGNPMPKPVFSQEGAGAN